MRTPGVVAFRALSKRKIVNPLAHRLRARREPGPLTVRYQCPRCAARTLEPTARPIGAKRTESYRRVDAETRWQFRKGSLLLTLHAPHITARPGPYPGDNYRRARRVRPQTKGQGRSGEPTSPQTAGRIGW
jgi:hypothetical protein